MTEKLTKELSAALHAAGDIPLEVIDPETNRRYLIIDEPTHRRAMQALRAQHDREAIAEGLSQLEAGMGIPAEQAFEEIPSRIGLIPRV